MSKEIDFILPTCPGMPESMWIASSSLMDAMIKVCWKLFAVFLAIKFINDGFVDILSGRFELRTHVKTVFQAILIGSFLSHYKFFLMNFDNFIDLFCIADQEVLQGAMHRIEGKMPDYVKGYSWFLGIKIFVKMIFDFFPKMLSVLTHAGAIKIMHYLKVVGLLLAGQFGPIAALFSLLPGPFKKGFATWAKSYINISCWAITLNMFWVLSKAFSTTSFFIESDSGSSLAGESVGHTLLSMVLFVAIFLTPTWTSKFIGGAIVANLGNALSMASNKLSLGKTVGRGMARFK